MSDRIIYNRNNPAGAAHLINADFPMLAWCGIKAQYRHGQRDGSRDEVTCPKCKAAIRANSPRSWKS